jgi:hypothetical protein
VFNTNNRRFGRSCFFGDCMGKRIVFLLTLALGVGVVMAQQARARSERARDEASGPTPEPDALQRRAALRQAVRNRQTDAEPSTAHSHRIQALSPQQRTALRQQLRLEALQPPK